ncbi:peptide chain release factor N(5)-glutamine methyltransferase [Candidatus Saccharibacteria bacterium]|nr:peptide chain release factor N(5)-glutamine methyltransferase [Candidatus Saccharibacteria bacterium]
MTIENLIKTTTSTLNKAGIGSARLDAELLLAHVIGRPREWLTAHDDEPITDDQTSAYAALVQRRVNREPLVHLVGSREFYGFDFTITPDVLTPRVETEQMVEWAIKYAPPTSSLIDIGTGSGAIAIAIKLNRSDLAVTATEVSLAALEVAKTNARRHDVELTFIESDLWDSVEPSFDTIVTNLPYLRDDADLMPEVRREPAVALFGGTDGLDLYRRFLVGLKDHLNPNGYLFTECDPWQHEGLIAEAAKYGLAPVEQGYFILGFKLQA